VTTTPANAGRHAAKRTTIAVFTLDEALFCFRQDEWERPAANLNYFCTRDAYDKDKDPVKYYDSEGCGTSLVAQLSCRVILSLGDRIGLFG
jgi:hypothetical protein